MGSGQAEPDRADDQNIATAAMLGDTESGASDARATVAASPTPATPSPVSVVSNTGVRSSTWYCAGGIVAGDAADQGSIDEQIDHNVVVTNTAIEPVDGTVTVTTSAGDSDVPEARRDLTVPAAGQSTVDLAELATASGMPAPTDRGVSAIAAVVELQGGGVAVEHEIVTPRGRSTGPCASGAASAWHFAWGATTRDARELLVLFNPFPSDVTVDAVFSTPAQIREPVRWQGMTVPARRVVAIDVGGDVTRQSHVAASVRAREGRLVVERFQVFDGGGETAGVTSALGHSAPARVSILTHGMVDTTAETRIDETVAVYNPTGEVAEVDVMVLVGNDGARVPEPFRLVVRPGRFEVLDYASEGRIPTGNPHTTVITSTNGVPVVAERVMSASGPDLRSVYAAAGSSIASESWTFPIGLGSIVERAGGEASVAGTSRYVVANPDPQRPTRVRLTLYRDGQTATPAALRGVELAAGGRAELVLTDDVLAGVPLLDGSTDHASGKAATSVTVHADRPILAERVVAVDGVDAAASPGVPASAGAILLDPSALG